MSQKKQNLFETTISSLLNKLLGTVVAVLLVLAVVLTFFSVRARQDAVDQALDALGAGSVRALAHLAEVPLDFDDIGAVRSLVLRIRKLDEQFLYAAVLDSQGGVVAADPPGYRSSTSVDSAGVVNKVVTSDVTFADKPVRHYSTLLKPAPNTAYVCQLGVDKTQSVQQATAARTFSILLSLLITICGGLTVGYVARRILIQSRKAAQRMQDTDQLIVKIAGELQESGEEILVVAGNTESGASEETAAVEEARSTMHGLLEASNEISDGADLVLQSAERSAQASTQIGERITRLSTQAMSITDISEKIRDIADKSDILALNASLEGARAGDTGRGFVLVGEEMRRLAETVGDAVHDIRQLANDMKELSQSTVLAAEDGQKLAHDTMEVSRRITLITGQQRTATEQATAAMEGIKEYTQSALAAARQSRQTATNLARAARELGEVLQRGSGVEQTTSPPSGVA